MFLTLAVSTAVALLMSFVVCAALLRDGPMDAPIEPHKSHLAPTPTSGGLGIALGMAGGLVALSIMMTLLSQTISEHGASLMTNVVAFAFIFLLIGFLDDARPLSARFKLLLFTAVSFGAAALAGPVEYIPVTPTLAIELAPWLGLIGTALWVFTLVNCANFMDGANGLSLGSLAIGLLMLGVIGLDANRLTGAAIGLCAAGAITGFLFFNFPNGRLFAGDAGALFCGAIAAIGSLLMIHRAGLSLFVPPILFFPILADALLTLLWRAGRRRSLLDGHSEHLYQIALRHGWSHGRVALCYWAATAVCGLIAYVAWRLGPPAGWMALSALALIATVVSISIRRWAVDRGIAEV